MPTMSVDPTKARLRAREVLIKCGVDSLPLDFSKITECCDMISIVPYSRAMEKYGISRNDLFELYGTAGSCVCAADYGFYTVYYNDLSPSRGRSRFTIAHELGHVFLRHRYVFTRVEGLSEYSYKLLEHEAHSFASYLLAPMPVLQAIGGLSAYDIAVTCGISEEAAAMARKQLEGGVPHDDELCACFAEYIKDRRAMILAGRV